MHSWGLSSRKAGPFKERKEEGKRELSRTRETKPFRMISTLKISNWREVHDCVRQGAFIRTIWMKAEMTNNVPWIGAEVPDYSSGRPIKAVRGVLDPSCRLVSRCQGTHWGPRCQFRLENDKVALPMALLVFAQSQAIRISITGSRWFGAHFHYSNSQNFWSQFCCQAGTFRSIRMQAPALTMGFARQVHILGIRILFLYLHPSHPEKREEELSANASWPPVGAESWSWPLCPPPLISTVTGEVRPPSTHRQPLVQSHSRAINKKPHLHKLTGTQCSQPSHLQGLHIHIDWLGPTVWPTWLLFFSHLFFKCMQSMVIVDVILICYECLREFEGCTQFSEQSLLMLRVKHNINQPHETKLETQGLSFLFGQDVCIRIEGHYLNIRDAFHLIPNYSHFLFICIFFHLAIKLFIWEQPAQPAF